MEIVYTDSFKKSYKMLSQKLKKRVALKECTFKDEPFYPSLKTHKLHGKMKDFWAFSINYDYRIVFKFMNDGSVRFDDVGTHKLYE